VIYKSDDHNQSPKSMMRFNSSPKIAIAVLLSLVLSTGCALTTRDRASDANNNDTTASSDMTTAATTAEADADSRAESIEVRYFADDEGLAIKGTDPVAYFTAGEPVAGSAEFTHTWGGATWQFASAENRDQFAADPEKFAPQYGGFCAWAVSQGYTAPIDPEAWKIVDDKLYLNYDKRIQSRWEKDIPGNIEKANTNWPGVLTES
jgi:YHS domain-containing protein